jgi:hypothetical protein
MGMAPTQKQDGNSDGLHISRLFGGIANVTSQAAGRASTFLVAIFVVVSLGSYWTHIPIF